MKRSIDRLLSAVEPMIILETGMHNLSSAPFPSPSKNLGKRRKKLLLILGLLIIVAVLLYIVVTPYLAPSIAPPFINADADNDGLSNEQEKQTGTDPMAADTDHDGLNDGLEVNTYATNPLVADTDGDGLKDGLEVNTYHTNPLVSDSDSDELNDGLEVNIHKTNPLLADTDGDSLKDGLEVNGWQISVNGFQNHVASNPLSSDSDEDGLSDADEYGKHHTDPGRNDTDGDGLPDRWEVDYAFDPTGSYDASKDPDFDGLTNLQEYHLGTIIKNGVLSFQKDLFVEIDYMSGYRPSTDAINWFVSYYRELGIVVHVTIDDEPSLNQLRSIGVSPESLTSSECSLVEQKFHDNPDTHVYVFYARAVGDPGEDEPLGWASEFGAFISKELVNANEGLKVLWQTDRIKTEKVVLLHEVGHTLKVITWGSDGKEDYCNSFGCIMAGVDRWWDVSALIAEWAVFRSSSPRYCQTHVKQINLANKWSVDENWIP